MEALPPGMQLKIIDDRLTLVYEQNGQVHYLSAEFLKGPFGYRWQQSLSLKQALPRALGLKTRHDGLRVVDGTAGLGKDAFLMACLGCHVVLLERSPILYELLQDGLKRAEKEARLLPLIQNQMQVLLLDLRVYLEKITPEDRPDVIYLDPMFPHRKKSALTKIEMRIIHDIVGYDEKASALLELSLKAAKRRVVVKRPRHAPSLQNLKPNFIVPGKKNRYDVYLTGGQYKNS